MKKNITMKTIAENAGVSIGTVDRAINNRGRINKETQEQVLKVAKELGYKTNTFASMLSKKSEIKIIVVLPTAPTYFFEKIREGMEAAEKELVDYKIKVTYLHPNKLDPLSQIDVIKKIDKHNADGILMNPANSMLTSYINKFTKDATPVVTFNSDVEESDRLFYVGPDMCLSGKIAGELMGKFMRGKGKVLVLEADPRVSSINLRKENFLKVIKEDYPDMHIVATFEFGEDDEAARAICERALLDFPEINGVFVNTAAGTVGVAKALEALTDDVRPIAVGFDAPEYVREMIKKNVLAATICQEPFLQGYYSMQYLVKHLLNGWVPISKLIHIKQSIILKHNADESSDGTGVIL